ncbi:hypothetical protein BB561_004593 [Smittium simulii]|uniref:cAMP-dependent protein kinase n=1 Tax=Smittium simulii TaxID=133385 RepID=A0A2T9YFD7_9FUNG|nr:hypothetical protein BB561_004593 [Smittium simulii]
MPFIKKILDKTISRPKSETIKPDDIKKIELNANNSTESRISGETISENVHLEIKEHNILKGTSKQLRKSQRISTKYLDLTPKTNISAKHKIPSSELEVREPIVTKISNGGTNSSRTGSGDSADTIGSETQNTEQTSDSNSILITKTSENIKTSKDFNRNVDNISFPTSELSLEDNKRNTHIIQRGSIEKLLYAAFDPMSVEPKIVDIKNYEFSRTIGTGSFGRVRIARKIINNEFYAVKILRKSEVVHSINLYMFMEFVIGGELFSYLRKYRRFPSPVAKFYAAEVTLAFEYLHSHGLVYRDLKPENILLDSRGHIKLTDMGFAKYVPNITWTLCGTPDYLAPEIIQAKGYGKSVDWYSLGILIFEMIAGYPPFYNKDHYILYERIVNGRIHWPPEFDPIARNLVEKLTTKDLTKRYGNLKKGSRDIKDHVWFQEVNWVKLANLEIAAPLVPSKKHPGDTGNFDRYPESYDDFGNNTSSDIFRSRFINF